MNSPTFIISTRAMRDKKFLSSIPWQVKKLDYNSPIIDFFLRDQKGSYNTTITSFFIDYCDEESSALFSPEISKLIYDKTTPPDGLSLVDGNQNRIKEWLDCVLNESQDPLAFLGQELHKLWTETILDQLFCPGRIPRDVFLYYEEGEVKVIAVQHLSNDPELSQSKRWVEALLNSFSGPNDDVCLILHDRDLYGYIDKDDLLLSLEAVQEFTNRPQTSIIVFQHSGSEVSTILSAKGGCCLIEQLKDIRIKLATE